MINFSVALSIYLGIGLVIATYETITSPGFDEEDKELWEKHEINRHMEFPKNPKLFFFCLISLVWVLHLVVKFKKNE